MVAVLSTCSLLQKKAKQVSMRVLKARGPGIGRRDPGKITPRGPAMRSSCLPTLQYHFQYYH